MSYRVDAEIFAQAVVSSSNETDVNKLLDLYVDAVSVARDHNSSLPKSKIGTFRGSL